MDIRKRDDISSLASREIRHKEEQSALTKRSVQIKSEELRVLESSWATSDLPEPGQELSDSERRAMEVSLAFLHLLPSALLFSELTTCSFSGFSRGS